MYPITGVILARVKRYWMENYDPGDTRLPAVACGEHCNLMNYIEKQQRGATIDSLPDPPDYSKMTFPIMTRGAVNDPDADCQCSICGIARENCGTLGSTLSLRLISK